MSDRETLHHTDVEGADETVTVGAYRWVHTLGRDEKTPGAPSVTLWAGGVTSECGCVVELLPAEVGLPDYPRLIGDLLHALGEAAGKAGPVDLDLLGDGELDAYISGLRHADKVLFAARGQLAEQRVDAVTERGRRARAEDDAVEDLHPWETGGDPLGDEERH